MKCYVCGKDGANNHHIKPRSEGGTDSPKNLIPLCKEHHDTLEGGNWMDFNLARKAYRQGSRNTGQNSHTLGGSPPWQAPEGWGWSRRVKGWYLWKKDKYGLTFKGPYDVRQGLEEDNS